MKLNKIAAATVMSAAALISPMAQAQSVSTTPVGFVALGADSGAAVPAGSEVVVAIPLLQQVEFAGTVASVTGSVITISQSLTVGQFDTPASGAPFMVELASGSEEGLFAVVTSNTASEITVSLNDGDSLASIVAGDKLIVRRATTLSTLFGSTTFPNNTRFGLFDDQSGTNNSTNPLFIYNGGTWFNGATFQPSDDVVLYPGESGLFINASATDIPSLPVFGEVPTSKSRVRISKDGSGAQDTRISYVTPTEEIIGDSGLSANAVNNDRLLVFDNDVAGTNKSAAQTLIFNGGQWFDGATFNNVTNTFSLKGGEGYVYRRSNTAPTGDVVVSDTQNYNE